MSMNAPPPIFKQLSQKAGIPEGKIFGRWKELWEESIYQLLNWLTQKEKISDDQLVKLSKDLKAELKKSGPKKGLFELVEPILKKTATDQMIKKLAFLFITNLEKYYQKFDFQEDSHV
ncbi:hypothetical protein ACFLZP_01810 [Patescibacteria group bacterium]